VWSVQQELSREGAPPAPSARSTAAAPGEPEPARAPNWKDEKKRLDKALRSCEKRLGECEQELQALQRENEELNQRIAAEASPSMEWVGKMSANGARIGELEELWLALAEERETHSRELRQLVGSS